MWIDTHCHLDALEFDADRNDVVARAKQQGVARMVVPAVSVSNFEAVAQLARSVPGMFYALGIHPLYALAAGEQDLVALARALEHARGDPRLVAVGEIGLDMFVPELTHDTARDHQQWLYTEQLRLARQFQLPVILHVRRSQDLILKGLRRAGVSGGIAHAFNGSRQQADAFIDLGFRLGFGGAMTFPRALRIRQLVRELPETALVLETDAPDIAPQWLARQRNEPAQLPRIASTLAELRGWDLALTARVTANNARSALPGLGLNDD